MNTPALALSARRFGVLGVLAAALAVWPAPFAVAQGVGQVNCAMAVKQSFGPDDQRQMQALVTAATEELRSDNPATSQRGRDRLLAPLLCPGVTVAFRLEYGRALEPAIAPLVDDQNERLTVNALRVLGELRTSGSIRALAQGLQSSRPVVRFGAASAFRTLLAAEDAGFPEREIDRALDAVRTALEAEQDPLVADQLVVALASTGATPGAKNRAMRQMSDTVATRLKSLRAQPVSESTEVWTRLAFRAVDAASQHLFNAIGGGGVDPDFAKSASVLGGQTLAFARSAATDAGDAMNPDLRQSLAGAVGAAEALLIFSHNALVRQQVPPADLRGLFEVGTGDGNLRPFDNAVGAWIGAGGRLTRAPYGAPASEFN